MSYALDKFRMKNEYDEAVRMLVKRPQEAMETQYLIRRRWKEENWTGEPEFNRCSEQHFNVVRQLKHRELAISWLGGEDVVSMDSVYVRDTVLMTPAGMVKCLLTKTSRIGEPDETIEYLEQLGVQLVGTIEYPGTMNGSDALWFDDKNLIVAESEETNAEGIVQLQKMFSTNSVLKDVNIHKFDLRERNKSILDGNYRVRTRLNSCLSFVGPTCAVLCPARLPQELLDLLKGLKCDLVECSIEEWNNFNCEVFMLMPHKGFMADTEGAQRIADVLKEKLNVQIKLTSMPDILLGRTGFAGIVFPFQRG